MRVIIFPLLSVVLGVIQIVFLLLLFLLWNAWSLFYRFSFTSFTRVFFSKHGVTVGTLDDFVLGYLDGTHGILSYVIPHESTCCTNARTLLIKVKVSDYGNPFFHTVIINAYNVCLQYTD